MSDETKALAKQIKAEYGKLEFGICTFYGIGQMAANDQTYVLLSADAKGELLSISFQHQSGQGNVGHIRVQKPRGLRRAAIGKGFEIESAESLELDSQRVERTGPHQVVQHHGAEKRNWTIKKEPALQLTK